MLKFAIIGFGGLGKVHFNNIAAVKAQVPDIELVAVCDIDQTAFTRQTATNLGKEGGALDLSGYTLYNDAAQLLEEEKLDFVISALPTYIHELVAVMALEKGLHVFSEKPMALNLDQCRNMADAAQKKGVNLMIGQCLRYWPEYVKLKELIESKTYGRVVRAEFARFSATPLWSWQNWLMDINKSGGAVLDMHVHDVDFINWAFGRPKSVHAVASNFKSGHDSIVAAYAYDDAVVTAACDWGLPVDYPFSPSFLVRFEQATVEMRAGVLKVYAESGGVSEISLPPGDAYVNEMIDFVTCIKEGRQSSVNTPQSAMQSLEIALAEAESARSGQIIKL